MPSNRAGVKHGVFQISGETEALNLIKGRRDLSASPVLKMRDWEVQANDSMWRLAAKMKGRKKIDFVIVVVDAAALRNAVEFKQDGVRLNADARVAGKLAAEGNFSVAFERRS